MRVMESPEFKAYMDCYAAIVAELRAEQKAYQRQLQRSLNKIELLESQVSTLKSTHKEAMRGMRPKLVLMSEGSR